MDSAQLLAVVDALKERTVAVIGDIVADEFVYGRVARVSREAPVLILEYDSPAATRPTTSPRLVDARFWWASSAKTSPRGGWRRRSTNESIHAASFVWRIITRR